LLVAERVLRSDAPARRGRPLAMLTTFVLVHVGWAIFRAGSWATLTALVARVVADPFGRNAALQAASFVPLVVAFYVLHGASTVSRPRTWPRSVVLRPAFAAPALAAAIALIVVFGRPTGTFIYFQF
jgi:hypothetical protein